MSQRRKYPRNTVARSNAIDSHGRLLFDKYFVTLGINPPERMAFSHVCGEEGVMDLRSRNVLIPPIYDSINPFNSEDVTGAANREGDWGILTSEGIHIGPWNYTYISSFSEGVAVAKSDEFPNRSGFIDRDGHWAIAPHWRYVSPFSSGLAVVETDNGKKGWIDLSGQEVIPTRYQRAGRFSCDLAYAMDESGEGFIDRSGKFVIRAKDWCGPTGFGRDGLAKVWRENGPYWFIDTHGQRVFDEEFDDADWFINGYAIVTQSGKRGAINRVGELVIPFEYDWLDSHFNGRFVARRAEKYGTIDVNNHPVVPFVFDGISMWSRAEYATVRVHPENQAEVRRAIETHLAK